MTRPCHEKKKATVLQPSLEAQTAGVVPPLTSPPTKFEAEIVAARMMLDHSGLKKTQSVTTRLAFASWLATIKRQTMKLLLLLHTTIMTQSSLCRLRSR
jgi:hypothetical protein